MKNGIKIFRIAACFFFAFNLIQINPSMIVYATEEENAQQPVQNAKPIIEIESYLVEEGYIEAGKNATVSLTIHNGNSISTASNMKIEFNSYSGQVYPAYGYDNQIYVGDIKAGESATISLPIVVNSQFNNDFADLICTMTYMCNGYDYSSTSSMILPSGSASALSVKSLEVSTHAIVKDSTLLSITFSNSSIRNVNDVELVIEGNVSPPSKNIELGSILSGKTATKDCYIVFMEAGKQTIDIKLRYTDSDGEYTEMSLGAYDVTVDEPKADEEAVSNNSSSLVMVGRVIAATALAVMAGTFYLFIRRR